MHNAATQFKEENLGADCVEALCNIKELNLRVLITALVFQQSPQEANVSPIQAAILPTLESYYVRGAEAGAQFVLGSGHKVSRKDAFESEEWTHRPNVPHPESSLKRIFNTKGTQDALEMLRKFEESLFFDGYNFGQAQALSSENLGQSQTQG